MYTGTSEEQKEKIAQEITTILMKNANKPEEADIAVEIVASGLPSSFTKASGVSFAFFRNSGYIFIYNEQNGEL